MSDITHHHLTAERINDDCDEAIMLTQQEGIDEPDTIVLHPWQLRAVCEQLGLIVNDSEGQRTIETMQRRMLLLQSRIDHLNHWLHTFSDAKHADLSYEQTYSSATAEIADEFCRDLSQFVAPREVASDAAQLDKVEPSKASTSATKAPRQLAINI